MLLRKPIHSSPSLSEISPKIAWKQHQCESGWMQTVLSIRRLNINFSLLFVFIHTQPSLSEMSHKIVLETAPV